MELSRGDIVVSLREKPVGNIVTGFIAAVVFLFLTQKDLANSSWTLATAATTGIPIIFKVLSVFQSNNTGQKIFNVQN